MWLAGPGYAYENILKLIIRKSNIRLSILKRPTIFDVSSPKPKQMIF